MAKFCMLQLIPLKEFFKGRYGVITRERLQVAYGSLQIELSGSGFQYLAVAIQLKQLIILFFAFKPEHVYYIGHHTVTINTVKITNAVAKIYLECYQVYEEALNLRQFLHTRDACVVKSRCYHKNL